MQDKAPDLPWTSVVELLELKPLVPEGGFYKETFRSGAQIPTPNGPRPVSTAIFYMITGSNFSAFHKLLNDEVYHFYSGKSVELHLIFPNGNYRLVKLGSNFAAGEVPQYTVPAGTWQASKIANSSSENDWSLLGTTMSPGFDFADFVLANRKDLIFQFPAQRLIIEALTRIQKL